MLVPSGQSTNLQYSNLAGFNTEKLSNLADVCALTLYLPVPFTIVPLEEMDEKAAAIAFHIINNSVGWNGPDCTQAKSFGEGTCSFAKVGKEYVGYIVTTDYTRGKKDISKLPADVRLHKYVAYLAVRADHQGPKNGSIALNLMRKAVEDARKQNVRKLVLDYEGNNEKSRRFYHKVAQRLSLESKDKNFGTYRNMTPKVKKTYYLNQPKDLKLAHRVNN